MPAIQRSVVVRDTLNLIAKRSNWAGREAGVIVVFCVVFIVLVGLVALFIHKKCAARRERKAQF
ncbi:hypothetical protein GE21DRAFT_7906 [Neurospora crassa]|uniref:Uncharacterized protein n=3 Tax=Neurospora TaxID=5140 RepID=A7UWV2_NEUCR|nr:hypothetical protein NCU11337 [Neurospora crassa OR74A]XP_009847849.1 uncharacterized protein NEUTE1DRAFT_93687 [Neurospora tetrasperma FGSC 2508]EGZ75409.1 hypothetical protein NEUTE2DRAFT_120320 [Neurospora tetrasperma FGSC 2509]KHE86952.1 hypothetical protein GE21DRAFT_7906 [Neurospora crassa]EDO65086.1 hypothetical protein NCU11337 [Neurospora crassa OR74A]EGO60609.1 hypothetical protein NEUTE1DRAFT_93687 [Neurospora tetrasperma FGSC 2508]|eukprot:XP_001728177.1 hypothetical protein NCU11337 [Neurospora crassa OR74A]